jgi:hypothetical protein
MLLFFLGPSGLRFGEALGLEIDQRLRKALTLESKNGSPG